MRPGSNPSRRAARTRDYSRIGLLALEILVSSIVLSAQSGIPLIEAVQRGATNRVRELVSGSLDVDRSEADGTRAVHWAVRRNDPQIVGLLLEAGASAVEPNRYGVTPLHLAAVNGDADVIRTLLESGADPNAVLPEGETVLMTAARTGVADALQILLAHGAEVDAVENWYGETALMWAAAEDHAEAIEVLVDAGAGVDARSALQTFERRRSGQSILSLGGWTPLMYAARENSLEAGRALIRAGAGMNLVDPDGATALVLAIINAHYEFAAMLLEAGADANVVDNEAGMGPLYAAVDMHRLAVGHGRPNPKPAGLMDAVDVVGLLLHYGADPNQRLRDRIMQRHHTAGDGSLGEGATPFMRAAKSGDVEIMRLLLAAGADPELRMPNRTTALMYASGLGWRNGSPAAPSFDQGTEDEAVEAIGLLVELGQDVNARNDSGDTALHVAVTGRGSISIVRFLIENGADPEAGNMRDQTPLGLAEARNSEIAQVMREAMGVAAVNGPDGAAPEPARKTEP